MISRTAAVVGVWVATWSTLAPAVANACGFFAYREAPAVIHRAPAAPPVQMTPGELISSAEQRLEEERFAKAGQQVLSAFPRATTAAVGESPLQKRAQRILALAVARSDGALPGVSGFAAKTREARAANLEWAVATMRVMESLYVNDPVAQTDLGEVLARLPKYEDEALVILGPLAERDLIGSAHAYAALSRLRAARGEGLASDEAAVRCRQMTKSPDAVCGPAPRAPADSRLASAS